MPQRRKLLFLVTEDWFFCSHFLGFAAVAQEAGLEPVVATRVNHHGAIIEGGGARLCPVASDRRALGPLALARLFFQYVALLRRERPGIVHCIALKSVVIGGLAAHLAGSPAIVLAPTGLGTAWLSDGIAARIARAVIRTVTGWLARQPHVQWLFENADDPCVLGIDGIATGRITIVAGAGVPAAAFPALPPPEPASPMRVAVVARMIEAKGIAEAVAAVRMARAAGHSIELELWGAPDPGNVGPVSEATLHAWSEEPGIRWCGRTDDVAGVWRHNHVAMLLSYREGLSRTLVEAAACARPIITSDVTGCRDVVREGREGLLVPPRDPKAAAAALARLAGDPVLRARMGAAARARFEREMTTDIVHGRIAALYRTLAKAAGPLV